MPACAPIFVTVMAAALLARLTARSMSHALELDASFCCRQSEEYAPVKVSLKDGQRSCLDSGVGHQ